jgi:heptaprenyl diphosphate synthase
VHPRSDGPADLDVVRGGVSVELVHLGSLYHDDVIDEATTRRTVDSVNARWGNLRAILAGDFLLAKASEIAASLGVEVAGLLAATIGRLCEGEVLELQDAYDVSRTEEAYLWRSIEGKTASLLSSACRIGGIVAELPAPDRRAHRVRPGLRHGLPDRRRHPRRGGHRRAARQARRPRPGGGRLQPALLGAPIHGETWERARALVRQSNGVAESVEVAQSYVDRAVAVLAPLADRPAAAALQGAARHLLTSLDTVPA